MAEPDPALTCTGGHAQDAAPAASRYGSMPFIDHAKGKAYYRHWAAAEPRAAVIFLHGFGEHTGVYTATASPSTRPVLTCGPSTSSVTGSAPAPAAISARSRTVRRSPTR
jgi:hypothetical protein